MSAQSGEKIIVMAGGTGGHVFPALAVAKELIERGYAIQWLGTAAGIEADLVQKHDIPLVRLNVQGLRGNEFGRLLKAPWMICRAIVEAWGLMRAPQVVAVIGLGGYVTGPGGIAARLAGRPLLIHEQNAVPGLTNRLLACIATQVLEAFPGSFASKRGVQYVGNPVRAEIAALSKPAERFASHEGALRILVLGGSQGAVALNELVPQSLAVLSRQNAITVRHQCGKRHVEKTRTAYLTAGLDAEILPFIEDMAAVYAWADLIICRSGALTVAELAAAGVASVLIPFPFAVDDHQTLNARFLADAGAALLCPQSRLSIEGLKAQLQPLMNREVLLRMAEKARALAKVDATHLVADACEKVKV